MTAGKPLSLIVLVLFFAVPCSWAQKSKAQLQKERQQNLEKIAEAEKILTETTNKKKNSVGELTALKERIGQQENLIATIKNEVSFLDGEISENNDIIRVLEDDLSRLKGEYRAMAYAAQKAYNSAGHLLFLFSAKSFDQFVMRKRYMEQYGRARRLQGEHIVRVQDELSGQVKEIQEKRTEKNALLNEQVQENENLTGLRKKHQTLIKTLEKEERGLRADLEATKKATAALDREINKIIKEELEREARALKTTRSATLSAYFEGNKAKFPWPVTGFVSMKFGKQPHPVLKGIVIQNDGINIQTQQGERVKAIFEGEVSKVAFMQGLGNTILIKHGEYFTLYMGMKDLHIKQGQKVASGQEIGIVNTNAEGISELRFRIYKNIVPLDPQNWLLN